MSTNAVFPNSASLRPGTVVSVWVFPILRHKGIVSDQWSGDKPMVISNSARAGGVAEEPWEVFAAGQAVTNEGYPSNLWPTEVVSRARSLIGTRYHLLKWNCEHLTRYAHGQQPASPQVAFVVGALVLGTLIAVATAE
jgi:hypothetical protein